MGMDASNTVDWEEVAGADFAKEEAEPVVEEEKSEEKSEKES